MSDNRDNEMSLPRALLYRFFGLPKLYDEYQARNFSLFIGSFLGVSLTLCLDHNEKIHDFLHQNLIKNGSGREFPLFAAVIVSIVGFLILRSIFCNYSTNPNRMYMPSAYYLRSIREERERKENKDSKPASENKKNTTTVELPTIKKSTTESGSSKTENSFDFFELDNLVVDSNAESESIRSDNTITTSTSIFSQ